MPSKKAQQYFAQGVAAHEAGKCSEAIRYFDKVIELAPKDAGVYYNRGNSKAALDQHTEAIRDFDKAIELDPKHAGAYSNRGVSKGKLDQHTEAIRDFDKAMELDPKHANAYSNRGNSKVALGQHTEAIRDYDVAIELDPKHAVAYYNRGNSKAALGQHTEAIRDYDVALRIQPGDPEVIHNRAVSLALLQAQKSQEEITGRYQAQLEEQQRKFDEELKAKLAAGEKIIIDEELGYATDFAEIKAEYKSKESRHAWSVGLLIVAAVGFYGFVVYKGLAMLGDGNGDIYGIIPFITLATLALIPFYLLVHSLGRDKARALALREDIRSKRALALLAKYYNEEGNNEALLRLFDHHTHSGTPSLILGAPGREQPASVVRTVANVFDRDKSDGKGK